MLEIPRLLAASHAGGSFFLSAFLLCEIHLHPDNQVAPSCRKTRALLR